MKRFMMAFAVAAAISAAVGAEEWRPKERWCGFNLLGMFRANYAGLAPDPRVDGYFPEDDFRWIHEWGFNFVRLPLDYRALITGHSWTNLDENAMKKLDAAVGYGKKYGIHVQLCFHRIPGYCILDQTEAFPLGESQIALDAACELWRRFAKRYRGIPNDELSFNLFNEPTGKCAGRNYAKICRALIDAIREEDPERFIVLDGDSCASLPVPEFYPAHNVGQAFRGYTPHLITHCGANWMPQPKDPAKLTYPPTKDAIARPGDAWTLELPSKTAEKYQPALDAGEYCMIGEFGCRNSAPHHLTLAWMEDCLKLWNSRGLGWALWNLRGSFGILDSGRADVEYEDFHGHKLDRKMLELMRKYCK